MQIISIKELELLTFFEVEPTMGDPNDPWIYNDSSYQIARGEMTLSFSISPGYKDVRIILKHQGNRIYELNALRVHDVRYLADPKRECLQIDLTPDETLYLWVKPTIEFLHETRESA